MVQILEEIFPRSGFYHCHYKDRLLLLLPTSDIFPTGIALGSEFAAENGSRSDSTGENSI